MSKVVRKGKDTPLKGIDPRKVDGNPEGRTIQGPGDWAFGGYSKDRTPGCKGAEVSSLCCENCECD